MEIETGRLPKDEQVPLLLRGLFEQRGYRRYRMSNFEAVSYTHLDVYKRQSRG